MGIGEDHGRNAGQKLGESLEKVASTIADGAEQMQEAAIPAAAKATESITTAAKETTAQTVTHAVKGAEIGAGALMHAANVYGIGQALAVAPQMMKVGADAYQTNKKIDIERKQAYIDSDRQKHHLRDQQSKRLDQAVSDAVRREVEGIQDILKRDSFSYNEVGAPKDTLIGVEKKGQEQCASIWILGIVCNESRKLSMLLRSLEHMFPTAKIASGSNHRICLEVIVAMTEALPPNTPVFIFARFANVIGRTEAVHLDEEVFNVPYNLAAGIKFIGLCTESSPDSTGHPTSGAYCRSSISALATVTLSEGTPELFLDATRWRKTALKDTFLHITRGERLTTLKNLTWKQNMIMGTSAASAAAEATTFKVFGSGYLTMGWHAVSSSSQCLIGLTPAMWLLVTPLAVLAGARGSDWFTADHVCLLNGSSTSNRPVKLSKKLLDELKQYAHTYFRTFSDSFGPVQSLSAPVT